MSNSINRQAAVDAVNRCSVKEVTPAYMLIDKADVMMELIALPSVEPERKKGRWIKTYRNGFGTLVGCCSQCRVRRPVENFCPNCGSRNVKEGEK